MKFMLKKRTEGVMDSRMIKIYIRKKFELPLFLTASFEITHQMDHRIHLKSIDIRKNH